MSKGCSLLHLELNYPKLGTSPLASWSITRLLLRDGQMHCIRLRVLELARHGLEGPIPPQFSALVFLERLYLQGNKLTGQIPRELACCSRLQRLALQSNQLSGPVPAALGKLSFSKLDISHNLDLGISEELRTIFGSALIF